VNLVDQSGQFPTWLTSCIAGIALGVAFIAATEGAGTPIAVPAVAFWCAGPTLNWLLRRGAAWVAHEITGHKMGRELIRKVASAYRAITIVRSILIAGIVSYRRKHHGPGHASRSRHRRYYRRSRYRRYR